METIGSSETTSLAEEHTTITVLDGEPTTVTVLDGNQSLEANNNQETLLDPARLEDNSPNNATTEEATEPSPVVETPSGIPVDSAPVTNSPMVKKIFLRRLASVAALKSGTTDTGLKRLATVAELNSLPEIERKVENNETQAPMPVENGVENGQVSRGAPTLANGLRPGAKKFASLAKSVRILNRAAAKTQDNMHVGVLQAQTEFLTKFGMGLPHLHAHSSQESGIQWEGNKMKFIKNKLVFDSNADYYFHWLIVVSLAVMYNLFFIVFRCVFTPSMAMLGKFPFVCINLVMLVCDIFCDGIYLIDMFVKSRTDLVAHQYRQAPK
uniref:Uncharacterized protein n=1 Tax=Acrobeloides nanus TaxID=290746 RepID=A0A914CFH7_9BILA